MATSACIEMRKYNGLDLHLIHSNREILCPEGHRALLVILKVISTFFTGFIMHFADTFMGLTVFLHCYIFSDLSIKIKSDLAPPLVTHL